MLHTLQISHNNLKTADDIEHLMECPNLGVLDISHNKLDDPACLDVFAGMKSLVRKKLHCLKLGHPMYWWVPIEVTGIFFIFRRSFFGPIYYLFHGEEVTSDLDGILQKHAYMAML